MRIKNLTPILVGDEKIMKSHRLKNTTVVIDAQSIFFNIYKVSNLPYALGCESDKFADYLRTYLDKFKKANLKCHFLFKGGHKDKKMLDVHFEDDRRILHGRYYIPGRYYDDIVVPLLVKDVFFQTLDEMGFDYTVCNDDHVTECIALALQLDCPLIGNNMQYFFSQVQYIPERNTVLDENDNLQCAIYSLSRFLTTYYLTEEKLILFIMLTDLHVFEEKFFMPFFQSRILLTRYNKINLRSLLKWLSLRKPEQALKEIFEFLSHSNQALFMEKKTDLEKLNVERKKTVTKTALYVKDKNNVKFTQSDPDWFEKGVFLNYIAISYVNVFRYQVVEASNAIEDYDQDNSVILSIDIVKYAYDLLTNFKGGEIDVVHKKNASGEEIEQTLTYGSSVRKPDYEATLNVFENGWDDIKELNLFEHFIIESLQSFDFAHLNSAPADARLLIIALVYFSRKKSDTTKLEVCSVLLSYVMLGVVFEKRNKDDAHKSHDTSESDKPLLDSLTDADSVTAADCDVAWSLMRQYFEIRGDELSFMFERAILHPLVEFQRCLQELNYLNRLCGSQFEPTVYSKTYNGTFVYKILHLMKGKGQDGFEIIKSKLNPAPTVLAFLTGLIEIYETILYE